MNIALLIDADNSNAKYIDEVMALLESRGLVCERHIFGDWALANLACWQDSILKHALRQTQQNSYVRGKNATDIALVIAAMELLFARPEIDEFAIMSSDSDFTPLVQRLRQMNKSVLGLVMANASAAFRMACSEYVLLSADAKPKSLPMGVTLLSKIADAIDEHRGADGLASMLAVGESLAQAGVTSRDYGHSSYTALLQATDGFYFKNTAQGLFVSTKPSTRHKITQSKAQAVHDHRDVQTSACTAEQTGCPDKAAQAEITAVGKDAGSTPHHADEGAKFDAVAYGACLQGVMAASENATAKADECLSHASETMDETLATDTPKDEKKLKEAAQAVVRAIREAVEAGNHVSGYVSGAVIGNKLQAEGVALKALGFAKLTLFLKQLPEIDEKYFSDKGNYFYALNTKAAQEKTFDARVARQMVTTLDALGVFYDQKEVPIEALAAALHKQGIAFKAYGFSKFQTFVAAVDALELITKHQQDRLLYFVRRRGADDVLVDAPTVDDVAFDKSKPHHAESSESTLAKSSLNEPKLSETKLSEAKLAEGKVNASKPNPLTSNAAKKALKSDKSAVDKPSPVKSNPPKANQQHTTDAPDDAISYHASSDVADTDVIAKAADAKEIKSAVKPPLVSTDRLDDKKDDEQDTPAAQQGVELAQTDQPQPDKPKTDTAQTAAPDQPALVSEIGINQAVLTAVQLKASAVENPSAKDSDKATDKTIDKAAAKAELSPSAHAKPSQAPLSQSPSQAVLNQAPLSQAPLSQNKLRQDKALVAKVKDAIAVVTEQHGKPVLGEIEARLDTCVNPKNYGYASNRALIQVLLKKRPDAKRSYPHPTIPANYQ